jgi:alanyl-tRNA synthetase
VTQRLYYNDSYLAEFTAKVTAVEGERVYLDRTAFYPTSGGQPHDLGELGGVKVIDVVDEEQRIAHVLSALPALAPGADVSCRVDWTRRFDFMQQHTGQHLLSAVFEELFGHKTVSVHFGDAYSTLDLDTESLSAEGALHAERRANDIVLENRPVTMDFEDALNASGLRKAVERTGTIRTVSIRDVDKSACGGTHVRTTGEIGSVMIRRVEKHKKQSRIEFLCGRRALARARADYDALSGMAATMTAAIDELPALVVKQAANLHAADAERRKLADELARYRARERYDATVPEADGVRRIVERAATLDELRALAPAIALLPKALFVGATASPCAVVLAASEDSGVNAGATLKAMLATHGGRGGGSPRVAQGTVGDAASLEAIVAALLARHR